MNVESEMNLPHAKDIADISMVGRMRLVLATSALLTVYINSKSVGGMAGLIWLIFCTYLFHSIVLYILSRLDRPFLQSKLIHWLDVVWYALIVLVSGNSNSIFFLFFFFAILTSSFRWGFEEGARITLASAVLFVLTSLLANERPEMSQLMLHATFLLTLGYMIAHWGESEIAQKRRLALLSDVNRLSNPRFGVDQTIATVLEKTRTFFKAGSCILVMQDIESSSWSLRTAMKDNARRSIKAEQISAEAAAPLMDFPQDQVVVYNRSLWPARSPAGTCMTYANAQSGWVRSSRESDASLAELLEARSFITASLSLRKGEGRIYVVSSSHGFRKSDALFLNHITAQTFPVIENIELLDRLASEAAARERKKIARDLHDTAIQPYIGLRHGLSAVRNKAAADNPLIEDLDKLAEMAAQVVGDLRRFAGTFRNGTCPDEPVFLIALRRQAAQVREFYGIDITVCTESALHISDRLAAEIFQVVNEGMSNIRKHTSARRGFIRLKHEKGWLNIRIENECADAQAVEFIPKSIAERAAALGGMARVTQGSGDKTVVHVDIPV